VARRGNNEGSVYQRRDGRWVAAVVLPGGRRKAYYARTRAEAAQKLTTGLKAVQDGLPLPSEQLKVGRYLEGWLHQIRPAVRPGTWRRYEQLLRLQVLPTMGALPLPRLSASHLQRLYADCLTSGYSPNTVRLLHSVLRRAMKQALHWGLVARNVVSLATPPREQRRVITPLSAAQARAFLEVARSDRFHALYVLALTTGMRRGELLAVRWQDMDLARGALQVRHTLLRTPTGFHLAEPKTARARRRIALSPMAVSALRTHRIMQAEGRLRVGSLWVDQGLVFPTRLGTPMEASNLLTLSFRPLLATAGLPSIRFHDLRHTAATLLLLGGVHPKVVSELLGHSSIRITLDIYSHVLPDMQEQAVGAMERLLTP
jgi:integrase